MSRSRLSLQAILSMTLIFTFIALAPHATSALSITSISVSPGAPVHASTLVCLVNATGTGTLVANITWYNGSTSYALRDESIPLTSGIQANSSSNGLILPNTVLKGQSWTCQATVDNTTATVIQNSTPVVIQNSPPTISFPNSTQSIVKHSTYSQVATATDVDNDPILTWISSDLNASVYGNTPLFTISPAGAIDFTPGMNMVGNHTVAILAYDGQNFGGANVVFDVLPADMPPVLNDPGAQIATVGIPYSLVLLATDEENDSVNFTFTTTAAINLTQMNAFQTRVSFPTGAPLPGDVGFYTVNVTAYQVNDSTKNSSISFTLNVTQPSMPPNFTSYNTSHGTQGQNYTFFVNATENNSFDQILFSIGAPGCAITNPWSITTISNLSSNAVGLVNTTLTNNNIACRAVRITATAYHSGIAQNSSNISITLNLTNVNDPPIINEISASPSNTLAQQNMSSLIASASGVFTYLVNGSDPDQLTYAGDNITYSSNDSSVPINASTGLISFTPNQSMVGIHLVQISLRDAAGLTANATMNLSVLANSAPVISPIAPISCAAKASCTVSFSASAGIPGSNLTFTSNTTLVNFTQLSLNTSQLQSTYGNGQVGNYTINLTVTDIWGLKNSTLFTLQINNTNEPPLFDSNKDNISNPLVLPGPVVVGHQVTWFVIMTDPNFRNVFENLTFNVNITGTNTSLFNISKFTNDTGIIQFTPSAGDVGNYTVNVLVTDFYNASVNQSLAFSVIAQSAPPTIQAAQPFWSAGVQTNDTLVATGLKVTDVTFSENTSVMFNLSITDPDTALGAITASYYVDGVFVANRTAINPAYNWSLDFFSSGSHTVLAEVTDDTLGSDNFTWNVTVIDVPRPPIFRWALSDHVINQTTLLVSELNSFINPDDDLNSNGLIDGNETNTLVFTAPSNPYGGISFSGFNVTVVPLASGSTSFNYTATNLKGMSVDSNGVLYTIFYNPPPPAPTAAPVSSSGGGGGGGGGGSAIIVEPIPVPKPYAIDILVPKPITIYENGTIIAPLAIHNAGNVTLSGITLTSRTDANVSMHFLVDTIGQLYRNQTVNTSISITGYRFQGTFEVYVTATVKDPSFNDSAVFYINSVERGSSGDAVNTKITSARDLLTSNPACGELASLVDAAQSAYARGDSARGQQILDSVSRGCVYLQAKRAQELQQPTFMNALKGSQILNYSLGALLLGLLITGALLVAHYARQQ